MEDYYIILNLNYSSQMLIDESFRVRYKPFEIDKKSNSWFDYAPTWMQGRIIDTKLYSEIHRLTNVIKEKSGARDVRPRFYRQEKNTHVPMHADVNTKCCINVILSEKAAPIVFEDIGEVNYKCALLNITKRHMVPKFKDERLLLKFSIFDKTYEEVKRCMT